jgi:hypothetical protein
MIAALPRRIATALLQSAISIAPKEALDWGHAMLGELCHVEGNWSAFFWSLGSAGVLAKHALVALIFPSRNRPTIPSGGDLFSKEGSMRKPALAVIASCVVASLLFFLAPVFRQAFRVSLAQWHEVLHVDRWSADAETGPELDALAKKAEQNRDAEGLAFVANRHPNQTQRARLADEAVHLDPNLTWLYAVAGMGYLSPSEIDRRISLLKQWDPQNALPHLLAAQKLGVGVTYSKEFPLGKLEENPAWEKEMSAAFQSPKLDTYLDRQKELDHRVLSLYRIDDPFQASSVEDWYGIPNYGVWDCSRYAQSLLESGQTLESRGDRKAALEKYWEVARFGQMMGDGAILISIMRENMKEAYSRLGALSQMGGNGAAAAFYTSLADQFDRAADKQRLLLRNRIQGSDVSHWNAFLLRLSGLVMLFCAALLLLCGLGVVIRNRSLKLGSLHPSRATLALGFSAAVGSLLSSAILFVSYRPYAELLQRFLSKGDDAQLFELSAFLRDTQLPFGSQFNLGPGSWYVGSSRVVFYFWLGLTILCALAFFTAVLRHFHHRTRANATI